MQAICCRLFQSASSSSASIFCTYSMADSSPASSLTMPCQMRKQNLHHPLRSASFTFTEKKEAAQGCVPSSALGSGHAGTPEPHPGGTQGCEAAAERTLRIWSSAVSICSSCCIFCRVTAWLLPFRSCMSVQRGEPQPRTGAPPTLPSTVQTNHRKAAASWKVTASCSPQSPAWPCPVPNTVTHAPSPYPRQPQLPWRKRQWQKCSQPEPPCWGRGGSRRVP